MSKPKTSYVPGVCNLGPAEIQRRKQAGWLGAILTVVVWAVLIRLDAPAIYRLGIGLPAGLAAIGFIQAGMHFCAGFGVLGIYNVTSGLGVSENAFQAEMRRADQRKAWQIIGLSLAVAVVVSVIGYLSF